MAEETGAWGDAQTVRSMLVRDGWVSPDTYSNCFRTITDIPAVYLFLLYRGENYQRALVAYVGMSTNLSQRMSGHEILAQISVPGCWAMRWFKPTQRQDLRMLEREYISRFDPPWNIVGRRRGVPLT